MQGSYKQGQAYLDESLRIKTQLNNQRGMTFSLLHIGHVFHGLEKFDSVENAYHHALELASELSLWPLELAALPGVVKLLARTEAKKALVLMRLPLTRPASWQRVQEEAQTLSEQIAANLQPVKSRKQEKKTKI